MRLLGADPWHLRDAYIAVVLGQMHDLAFMTEVGLGHLPLQIRGSSL